MKASIFLSLFFFPMYLWSQNTISGKIIDKDTNQPVEFSTVILLKQDSSVYKATITENQGFYSFNYVLPGNYILKSSLIGYTSAVRNLTIASTSIVEDIILEANAIEIKEVVVTNKRPLIEQKLDKLVINVGSSLITTGKSARQVLNNIPGVVSNGNGLLVLGSTVTIFIDGKNTYLSGDQLENLLNNMQGDQIDKVELITNPSAKNDAGVSGPIINIRTKRPSGFGLNGSLSLNLGINQSGPIYKPGINLNFRSKKINAFGNYSYGDGDYTSDITSKRYFNSTPPIYYDEKITLVSGGISNNFRTGIDYFPSRRHTIGILFNGGASDGINNSHTKTLIRNTETNNVDSNLVSPIKMNKLINYSLFNLNHKFLMDTVNGVLNTDIDFAQIESNSTQEMFITSFDTQGTDILLHDMEGGNQKLKQLTQIWSINSDYSRSLLKKINLDLGVKYSHTERRNYFNINEWQKDTWTNNKLQTDSFIYKENIWAAYFNLSYSYKNLSIMAGLRAENTTQNGTSIISNNKIKQEYFGLFPSASFQYSIDKNQSLSLSYSKKLTRPSYSMLNPFKFYISPKSYEEGNPLLAPSFKQSYQLRYKYKKMSITILHNITKNNFIQEPYQNELTKEIGYTYKNFGLTKNYGASAFYGLNLYKFLDISLNGSFYYVIRESRLLGINFYKEYPTGDISLNNTFTILKTVSAELSCSYISSYYYGALFIHPKGNLEMSIQKTLWKNKGSIVFSISDPFIWQYHQADFNYGNIMEYTTSRPDTRIFRVAFRYNFGSDKIKQARKRNTGSSEEVGRTQ